MEVIKRVSPDNPGGLSQVQSELHKIFNEQGYSDYVVVCFLSDIKEKSSYLNYAEKLFSH